MVKIPTYESQTVAKAPISRNRPLIADSGAAEVYEAAAQAADVAGEVIKKHKAIKNDKDLLAAMKKYKVGDMDNNQPGENQMIITASTSDDFETALPSYNAAATAWQQKVAESISNGQVRDKFLIKSGESLLSGYLNVERSVFTNNRTSYQETIKDDATNTVNNYVEAFLVKDTLGLSQAGAKLFGTVDNNGDIKDFSFGQRLKDRGMLPAGTTAEQYDENMKVAMLNTLAVSLIENNPAEFINLEAKDFFNLIDPGKLVEYKAKANESYNNKSVISLLEFLPLDTTRSEEETEALFLQADSGNFGGDENKKALLDSLDAEGKLKFSQALSQRKSEIKAEITWDRQNTAFKENVANEAVYMGAYQGIFNGTVGIDDLNGMEWQGVAGNEMKDQLKLLVVAGANGELPTDGGLEQYNKIFDQVVNKEILNVTSPFLLPGETEAKSIIQRTGGLDGLGFNQFANLSTLMTKTNNKDLVFQEQQFQAFLTAYADQIIGSPAFAKYNVKGKGRQFQFNLVMRTAYENGIKEGFAPIDLLSETSPNFIGKNIDKFIPSSSQLMSEIAASAKGSEEGSEVPQDIKSWLEQAPQKPPGMSKAEWEKSTEYKAWKKLEPTS
jgi:hypothetical protein